jgi:hypothetical protein
VTNAARRLDAVFSNPEMTSPSMHTLVEILRKVRLEAEDFRE